VHVCRSWENRILHCTPSAETPMPVMRRLDVVVGEEESEKKLLLRLRLGLGRRQQLFFAVSAIRRRSQFGQPQRGRRRHVCRAKRSPPYKNGRAHCMPKQGAGRDPDDDRRRLALRLLLLIPSIFNGFLALTHSVKSGRPRLVEERRACLPLLLRLPPPQAGEQVRSPSSLPRRCAERGRGPKIVVVDM